MSDASDDRTVSGDTELLSERQAEVLRVVVSSWIGQAAPVASETIAQLVPTACSSATVRTILAELAELGLVTKPHASAGRFPTDGGLRHYVRHLLGPRRLGREEMRDVEARVRDDDPERRRRAASRLLSERTRQLGFVFATRLADVELRHVSLVRLSSTRVLVVLVTRDGTALRRVVNDEGRGDQAELDRMAATLSETLAGGTLGEARARLAAESRALRDHADRLRARALHLAFEALSAPGDEADLVIATRLAVLDQPELHDPERLRELFGAIEARERLIEVVDQVLDPTGVTVRLGGELDDPSLRHWALVAAPFGAAGGTGALGVIGPSRMDYARVIPLVGYLSELFTERPTS